MLQYAAMVFARRRALLVIGLFSAALVACAASGCADTDPHYGPPEAIRGRVIDFGNDSSVATVPATEGGMTNAAARTAFDKLYAAAAPSCNGCHASAGQPGSVKFVPASADAAYVIFQMQDYKNLTRMPPGFYNKGLHSGGGGPALTADQKALTEAWAAAEKGGATMPMDSGAGPVDAGGG